MEYNTSNLEKLPNEVKQRIHAKEIYDSDCVMTCINRIPSTSNTLKKLLLNKSFHSSYIQIEFNVKEESFNNIFSSYIGLLLKNINHYALLQERKLNIDAAAYEKIIDAKMYKTSDKK